ncbi:3-dehydroquinate synthase [Wenyingzhuangia heitensis]|uniref:3-dehydroquinate synthase n=1 Tax=Wenyingzhuangia heitensis TaxID=1487859 RepID=A0ABX0UA64_9FLAO|nr:3-dehydroquinate synthase [Wenyingzhuangia heitensis]NIJ45704.1 3-dehydroquinate synthase [Wenyingzhuangia heitensis]
MQTIQSTSYPVLFQENGYNTLNDFIKSKAFKTVFILVDENTHEHCLPILQQEITADVVFEVIEIESGEVNKNLGTCMSVWHALTDLGADRKSLLINIGGGVITDMGGFVASTYKRGIQFINIPTTLLSMVDASVGGKTGVDLGVLKNQIGLFADPEMVIIDPLYLKTLSEKEITSGMAEIIKYGLTYDASLWKQFTDETKEVDLVGMIHRSIEIKNEVVLEDRLEANLRKILNYGHTIGHAVESHFLESDDKETLTHGQAIALGMITEAYISSKLFNFPLSDLEIIKTTITRIFGKVPVLKTDYPAVIDLMKHDKKNVNGQVNFVLLESIETCKIDCKVSVDLIQESLDYYLL